VLEKKAHPLATADHAQALTKNHMKGTLPSLQIRHSAHGERESWTVRATLTFEEIAGFHNEADANDWITNYIPDLA
jgi:hypothetical protein